MRLPESDRLAPEHEARDEQSGEEHEPPCLGSLGIGSERPQEQPSDGNDEHGPGDQHAERVADELAVYRLRRALVAMVARLSLWGDDA